MSKSERLFTLLQILLGHKYPLQGTLLAQRLNISLRTLYRDIDSLRAQGANIEGEAGIGYLLRKEFELSKLMLTESEIEALVLGMRWVKRYADSELSQAAENGLSKISALLPPHLSQQLQNSALFIANSNNPATFLDGVFIKLRHAIQQQLKVKLTYRDEKQQSSQRIIYPFAIGFFEQAQLVAAWCELRQAFRHFRPDRILAIELSDQHYQPDRTLLLQRWQKTLGDCTRG
ncbi:YafY family transcriptional regulator [Testudinibacter sp. TR-2022]|uniref:helix-turn-helix transcriptional regulator n=1 Tax=Testudinibacter sp. TR-2022 TaxID=2585029 RepID=UPI00111A5122|nr:YafY family protein [Testudinibacter sp. TR-2022]TNH03820.1 YafY family transcriptional regulator [Pasteurellaceae bacterium Phil31]TNH11591.1 YafY family transcriptional regulator [Testudinibacter sp. TR-2022]TNH11763.1 YafY family transcriptional regulator [Testudinibacter sp. TR-2022]TNH15720.1 YafY family transcriptional regulator [Testudinibacter sp. TR-2022]TNH20367.1 YafY family transcriptional regulator [Testudinibacter sp. TR-2022]